MAVKWELQIDPVVPFPMFIVRGIPLRIGLIVEQCPLVGFRIIVDAIDTSPDINRVSILDRPWNSVPRRSLLYRLDLPALARPFRLFFGKMVV